MMKQEQVIRKPSNSQWTDEQWQSIVDSGKDILVAAAAGSGKTAVLVERIIHKVTHPEEAVDVDKLLIVTFTNAAAAEMRARIAQALDQALAAEPDSEFLRRQLLLLNRASIMTFHAFCMSVVKRYSYLLDLDPAFRTVEETESEILREEVIIDLLEDYYGKENNEAFYNLVDAYSNDRSDSYLQSLLLKLYDFSRSHPSPQRFLDNMIADYEIQPNAKMDDLSWTMGLKSHVLLLTKGLIPLIEQAMELCELPGGPTPYLENLKEDRESILSILNTCHAPWDELYQVFQETGFSTLKRVKKQEADENIQEQVKKIRETVKKRVMGIKEELFSRTGEELLEDLRKMAPHVSLIIQLVKDFTIRYQTVKLEKALVDFSDLEHYCLEILSEVGDEGTIIPTPVALKYRYNFAEILVDEYQDTNFVQETILQLLSKDRSQEPGNLYMVGDVKQSIYRFRLAEPSLFLNKYKQFSVEETNGKKIDLAANFRSRTEIIDGTNYLFKQIMDEAVGEIDYDEAAELKFGASYYPEAVSPSECIVIDRKTEEVLEAEEEEETPEQLLQTAELEAVQIAQKIKALIGEGKTERYTVYDKDLKRNRPIQFRDIVILLRSVQSTAPMIMDVLKTYGIPVHAELSQGYFEATEVAIMLSLLKVIDNPHQDIPVAAVLRSPIVGLTGEELSQIRLAEPKEDFFSAVKSYRKAHQDPLCNKLHLFMEQLEIWRDKARTGALADLIWQIYRDTGYYDYVAGSAGGTQRQANLKALYDRARQYESTSFRGLFRFLRFIERIQDRGNDLGEARSVGEQEDVVRIMTIHKSKGLEYPVVFVAGLNREFNRKDLTQNTLLHKNLGFATKYIDPIQRIMYPTIAYSATKYSLEMELIAEEMRVLYVALTRAREKLILIASVNDIEKTIAKWQTAVQTRGWLLQDDARYGAKTYFDWIGPALFRHPDAKAFHDLALFDVTSDWMKKHPSHWEVSVVHAQDLQIDPPTNREDQQTIWGKLQKLETVELGSSAKCKVEANLSWTYPYVRASRAMAKQTVTEIKRQQENFNAGYDTILLRQFRFPIGDRPKFLQEEVLTANERGTAMHLLMQHIKLKSPMTNEDIQHTIDRLVQQEIFTSIQAEAIDIPLVREFFETPIGKRMLNAERVTRELPFSLMVPVQTIYGKESYLEDEKVLVQGVIDCIIEDQEGITLIDYKSDAVTLRFESLEAAEKKLKAKYHVQLKLYRQAIEMIWKEPVHSTYLYFFDGSFFVKI